MVRNTTSAGTVAGTGIIRKPPGERGETASGDERKRSSCCMSAWFSTPVRQADAAELIAIDVFTARPGCQGWPAWTRLRARGL